jgi:bifunctional non-homologous end joining protein LigD
MTDRIPFRARPMLATLVDAPFERPGWVFEEKYDGYRILAYKEGTRVRLESRNAKDRTERFGEVAAAVRSLPDRTLLLDGEVVAFDRKGVSRFQLLQQGDVARRFAVFDCLYRNGRDLRKEPLRERRRELEEALRKSSDRLLLCRRLAAKGHAAYRLAKKKGFEGIVAKDEGSRYEGRRSRSWLKVKVHQEAELVIGGYTAPGGSRKHFGALLLGGYRGGRLVFVGKVGTGFSEGTLSDLSRKFRAIERDTPAFADPPREKGVSWLEPRLVAQIAFQEWTEDGKLRQPVYLGLRDDKTPRDVQLPEPG